MKRNKQIILRKVFSLRRLPYLFWLRNKVKNRRFLILSSGCNGGLLLHDLGMPFNTPTINMAFHSFEKFCTNLDTYLAMSPVPLEMPEKPYPVFKLGDSIIEGTHYRDNEEFLSAWRRRLQRFNSLREEGYEVLLMTLVDNLSENGGVEEFLSAPFRKLCYTNDPNLKGPEFVYIPDRRKNGYRDSWRAVGLLGIRVFERATNIPAFLNNTNSFFIKKAPSSSGSFFDTK